MAVSQSVAIYQFTDIRLKVFDPAAGVRRSLERTRSAAGAVEIAAVGEVLSLLGGDSRNCGPGPEGPRDTRKNVILF